MAPGGGGVTQLDALGKLCGYVLALVVLVLLTAGLGAVVTMLWRAAIR